MENKKYYVIAEDIYHQHIDREVHLYGLLHQLAFTAGKAKDAKDMEYFRDTAIRYGQIADEVFEGMNIPGRYLVFGDKADLQALRENELEPIDFEDTEDDDGDDEECTCLRCALEGYLEQLECMADIIVEVINELDALGGE